MMAGFITVTFRAAFIFCISGELSSATGEPDIPAFCITSAKQKQDFQSNDILPVPVNASDFPEPPRDPLDLKLELCPNNATLKISWHMNQSHDVDTRLCYKMKSNHDGQLLHKHCVKFFVKAANRSVTLTCWFPMGYAKQRPVITAVVETVGSNRTYDFYGEMNTSALDPANSCGSRDICELTLMESTKSLLSCNDTSSFNFDDRATIKAVWFDGIDSPSCRDSPVFISRRTSSKLDYSLNCIYHGLGHLKVLYTINNRVCLRYQMVKVICDSAPKVAEVASTTETDADDFTTFVIFGVVCMVVITTVVVLINFALQKLRLVLKSRRRYIGRNHVNSNGNEALPLKANISHDEGHVPASILVNPVHPVDKVIKREYLKRVDSMSSEGQSSTGSATRAQNVRKLHRSVTVALLENTETFYRKKILFLPTPFDTFSRDATNLLKAVFTLELSIPTQCCYDRDVYQQYMTSNRYKWIETYLGDYDRILVFLCFTTIRGQAKGVSILDDVLDHLLLTRIRPHCKVAFLHLTDSSENLEKNHHGDSFHLSDKDSFTDFVGEVLNYCGRNPLSEPDLLYRLTNCETSKHFLRYIGIRNV